MLTDKRQALTTMLVALLSSISNCGGEYNDTIVSYEQPIINGAVDSSDRYPAVVVINSNCSGVLVDRVHVVTAAHCVCPAFAVSPPRGSISSRRDAAHCNSSANVELRRNAASQFLNGAVFTHPSFYLEHNTSGGVVSGFADISLIRLHSSAPVEYTPIPLASQTPFMGRPCSGRGLSYLATLVGFGNNTCGSGYGIRRIGQNVVSNCDSVPSSDLVVMIDVKGNISAPGDSGGPLLHQSDALYGRGPIVVGGIASRGSSCSDSGTHQAFYSSVPFFYSWLDSTIRSYRP